MKIILNNSLLEIASKNVENRHKIVYNANISGSGTWDVGDPRRGFFIDIKQGDIIHIEKNNDAAYSVIGFTSTNNKPVNGESVNFANETSERIRESIIDNIASEDCYMFVITRYDYSTILEPKLIQINGLTLNEEGLLE